MKTPLILRYFLWSMFIFALSMFSLSFRIFDSLQYKTLALGAGLPRGAYLRNIEEVEFPFRTLPITGSQMSGDRYFEIVKEVVHRLKIAGARVVIVPVPENYVPSPHNNSTIAAIAADSIVIFAAQCAFNSMLPWERDLRIENKNSWWVKNPFYNRLKVPWGVMSPPLRDFSPVIRFVPAGFRENDTGEPVPDVATMALMRYVGIPDREELPLLRSRSAAGQPGIQTGPDGISYVRLAYHLRRQTEVYVGYNFLTDSVEYIPGWDPGRRGTIAFEEAWRNHKGTVVMIDWDGARRYPDVYYGGAYLQIFGSIFRGTFLTVHNEWNMLLITTIVVLLSVFSYTFRNGVTVVVAVLLAAASIVVAGWLFTSHNVVFEPIYIIVPMLLCGFILPIVKTAGEKRLAEEKIKSLEEENRRLLDMQRSSPPLPRP